MVDTVGSWYWWLWVNVGGGSGTGHIGVYLDSGDGDKTVIEKLLTSYMGEWCGC